MFNNLKLDYQRCSKSKPNLIRIFVKAIANSGFRAVMLYRIGHYLRKIRLNFCAAFIERLMHHSCYCWISTSAEIGYGLMIAHVGCLVIGGSSVLGCNCDVRQNITIGGNYNKKSADGRTQPVIGNGVSIGAGAVIIGPIQIGDNSIIGANAVVTSDMPSQSIIAGIPARVIKKRWSNDEGRML